MTENRTLTEAKEQVRAFTASFLRKTGRRPGVFIRTFGCQQNEADSERLAGMAQDLGYAFTENPEEAELFIYNTCAVREHAELKALSLTGQLKHVKEARPDAVVCLCGCMVAQEHRLNDVKNRYPYVDFLFGTSHPENFPLYLATALTTRRRAFYPDEEVCPPVAEGLPVRHEAPFRALVSIMYGCNNFCTYCVVPYVRGRERSRKKEDILAEIRTLVAGGCREIMLLGQNVNSYGHGLYTDYGFSDLLSDICRIEGDYWIRFMTSHPKDATRGLVDVIASHCGEDCHPKIVKQFHLPFQSGSDRILEKMNRHYTASSYLSLISYLKEKIPDVALSTDVIVGFPTETEEDFEDTLSLLRTVRYDALFSFLFSPRRGTPAEKMEPVPEEVKASRFSRLLAVQNEISLEKNRAAVGSTVRVLVEGKSKTDPSLLSGRTEKNRLVHFSGGEELIGRFVLLTVTSAEAYSLAGTLTPGQEGISSR